MNGNISRQKNGPKNEPSLPNAWRTPDKRTIQQNENIERKSIERKTNPVSNNDTNLNQASNEVGELVNLAHKVNIAERLKKQKEIEPTVPVTTEDDVLKKMLGVVERSNNTDGKNQLTAPSNIMSPMKQPDNTQQIDLNSLFGKVNITELRSNLPNPSSLPKPPTSWTKNSESMFPPHPSALHLQSQPPQLQQQQFHHHQHQQQQQQHFINNQQMNLIGQPMPYSPQFFPHQFPNMPPHAMNMMPYQHPMMPMYPHPMFIPNQNYPMPMMHPQHPGHPGHHMMSQPFMQSPTHHMMPGPPLPPPPPPSASYFDGMQNNPIPAKHNSPEGPQKLKSTLSGAASAFIPLQAARKNMKLKMNLFKDDDNNATTSPQDSNLDKSSEEDIKPIEVSSNILYNMLANFFFLFNLIIYYKFYSKLKHN